MRRSLFLTAVLIVGLLAGSNLAAAQQYTETTDTFFLRHDPDGEGGCSGAKYLSGTPGSGEPGCGYIGGAPLDEVFITATGEPVASDTYTTTDGTPLILDADRDLTGTMVIGPDGVGAGSPGFDIVVTGTPTGEVIPRQLGSTSVQSEPNVYVLTDAELTFEIDLPDDVDELELASLTVEYTPRGLYANHGYHQKNGESFIRVPTLELVE